MAKKKHPKLPNGFGSIKKLSGRNRRNPYGVYPPVTEFDADGRPKSVPALAYVDDWYYGFSILIAYHAGAYVPGVYPPKPATSMNAATTDQAVQAMLRDYAHLRSALTGQKAANNPTFAEVYEGFFANKFKNPYAKRQYSDSLKNQAIAAYKNSSALHDKIFKDLRKKDLQDVIDQCPLKHASLETIVSLFHAMYSYADEQGLVEKDYSAKVKINIKDDDEKGVPFTEEELGILWKNKDDPVVEMLLIMCYSGHRISEYNRLQIDLENQSFFGGIKTKAGQDRIVPIHPAILPLVSHRLELYGKLLPCSPDKFRKDMMYPKLEELHISYHTPHDCRHTFSWLCENAEVKDADRKRMLGHSFGNDITNAVYGHRTLEELRVEICKLKVCF